MTSWFPLSRWVWRTVQLSQMLATICLLALTAVASVGRAQDQQMSEAPIGEASDTPLNADSTISKQEWQLRIDQARARSEQARREWRLHPPPPPTRESAEKLATERALNDDTLQPGDIVATNRGLLQFRGRAGADGQAEFMPAPGPQGFVHPAPGGPGR